MVSQVESADRAPRADASAAEDTSFYEGAASWSGLPVASDPSDPLIGVTLHDTYVVRRILGEGGMGRVYEALHTRLPNKRVAIKVLHADLAMNSDLQLRFQREAETAASIDHPSVVGIYDIGRTEQGWQYMVCEHLTGLDLHTHLEHAGPLPASTLIHIGKRLCDAVEAAHDKGVIHRDLKPHNVFLVGDFALGVPEKPTLKVLDFGLSRFVDHDSQLTKTGMIMGTPGYMSPEQAHSRPTDHRTDIYGVGAILYAVATGRAPFVEDTPQMTVLAVMSREPERPRALAPSISDGLEVVIQRAMAKDPAQRYASMRELHGALAALERNFAPSLLPPKQLSQPADAEEGRGARLRLAFWTLCGFALLVLSGIGAVAGGLSLHGTTVDPTTTELILLGALGAMSTFPAAMALRRVRHHVWVNSAKVVDWVYRVRGPVVAALCAYGLAAFLSRFADELLTRWSVGELWFGQPPGIAYRGYSIALPAIGLLSALAMAAHRRWWRPRRLWRRVVFGPLLVLATLLLSLGLLFVTLNHRALSKPQPAALASAASPSATGAPQAPEATPVGPETYPQFAPERELVAAVAEGADGLRVLSERYPRDPAVLKALVLAFASKSDKLIEAVEATRRLLLVAPDECDDADVRYIVSRAASARGKAEELAFVVMSQHMGKTGADLLYDLMLQRPELETRAKIALETSRRAGSFSPALAIAYDLRFAPGCASRVGLLPRAQEFGDERSAQQLVNLSRRPPDCKKTKTRLCRSRCPDESRAFLDTSRKIYERLAARKSN